eukprot:373684-Pelagomonas_calceolata.AAC.1
MHIQGDVLKTISTLISNSHTNSRFNKVKSYAGIAGNECADAIANIRPIKPTTACTWQKLATICVNLCPPVRDLELEDWNTLVKYKEGEAFASFESRHVYVYCIESRMVANTA